MDAAKTMSITNLEPNLSQKTKSDMRKYLTSTQLPILSLDGDLFAYMQTIEGQKVFTWVEPMAHHMDCDRMIEQIIGILAIFNNRKRVEKVQGLDIYEGLYRAIHNFPASYMEGKIDYLTFQLNASESVACGLCYSCP